MTQGTRPRHRGFTLIEVLLAMAIGLVLIYVLSETFALTEKGWANARQSDGVTEQENRAAVVLLPLLASMQPPTPEGLDPVTQDADQALEFTTLPPQSRADGGNMHARLAIQPDGHGFLALVLDLAPAGDNRADAARHPLVLLSGLTAARLSCRYAEHAAKGAPPELVVVSWRHSGDPKEPHELVVRPRVSISGRCQLDLTSGTCRST